MNTFFDDVKAFHEKFGIPNGDVAAPLEPGVSEFRVGFMREELREYLEAVRDKNLHEQFDALVDLTYVVLGTAAMHGFDFNEGWRRVHEANMKKVRVESADDSKRGHRFDVKKPEGWQAPSLFDLLPEEQRP